jgi:hypothetical protein
MAEDGKGLRVEGQLAMDVQRARELHALMKIGAIKGLSIGYRTVQRSFKGAVRHLQELKLGEFSPVTFPMNTLAGVDGVKDLYGWEATEGLSCLLAMMRAGADFMVEETREGDTADAARMQTILVSISQAAHQRDRRARRRRAARRHRRGDERAPRPLDQDPSGTPRRDRAAGRHSGLQEPPTDLEPDTMSTLRSLQDGMKAARPRRLTHPPTRPRKVTS